jgi:hypothetical protein
MQTQESTPPTTPAQAAAERLRQAFPHILAGLEEAAEDGATPVLAIAAQNPDGSGKMILTIDSPRELLDDIVLALGLPPLSEEQRIDYRASKFISQFSG